ncbi:MAG TPA: DUF4870 domain-containing protein [Pseudolysinimonas sp.]|nr:DUF4870 domain-containing protein [Pseudolysinimonas sp.]
MSDTPPAENAPPPPAAPAAPAPAMQVPLSPESERTHAMFSHLISLLALLVYLPWVPALIWYLIDKDRGPFVRAHTATELNFQITMVLAMVAGVLLSVIGVGVLIVIAVPILQIVFGIIATVKANSGQWYTYPIAIRFVS